MTPSLDRHDLDRFRGFVARRLGLSYGDDRIGDLLDVLRERMRATKSSCFDAYVARLGRSPTCDELRTLAEHLTVNETFFFRNADSFRALSERVLPDRLREAAPGARTRILSAGCASGEEPYSVAIAVREALPDVSSRNVDIIAVDVNRSMLARAAAARYSPWSLRATPDEIRNRHFRAIDCDFVLSPEVRDMVRFEELNLVEDAPSFWCPNAYDIVFCRNVLMYFAPEVMWEVVERVRRSLRPGGFLFLGHAETLRGLSHDFHLCHTHDTFYYQRRETALAASPPNASTRAPPSRPCASASSPASWVEAIGHASDRIIALADNPRAPAPASTSTKSRVSTRDLALAFEAMREERFTDALSLLSELPPESRADPDALLLRAVLLTNGGELEGAEATCAGLLEIDELNAGAHYVMALCREHAGDVDGAIEHDRAAVYLDADFAMPHLHLGLMANRAGDPLAARVELTRALTLLAREDASRVLLFGGGFSRDTLIALCRAQLGAIGGCA